MCINLSFGSDSDILLSLSRSQRVLSKQLRTVFLFLVSEMNRFRNMLENKDVSRVRLGEVDFPCTIMKRFDKTLNFRC